VSAAAWRVLYPAVRTNIEPPQSSGADVQRWGENPLSRILTENIELDQNSPR